VPRVDAAALWFHPTPTLRTVARLGDEKKRKEKEKRGVPPPPPPDNISIIDAGEIAQPFIFASVIRK
jgi:hypothetical protein